MIYGIPGLVADTEQFAIETVQGWCFKNKQEEIEQDKKRNNGLSLCLVVAPPSCVLRITLFSEMWRTFDRGLYNFMLVHIYLPLRKSPTRSPDNCVPSPLTSAARSILASSAPFLFVLVFHNVTKANVIWIAVNATQFYIERCIRWSDRNTVLGRKLNKPDWINWRHRLLALLHAISLMSSLAGLIFFLFDYDIGMAFAKHIIFSFGEFLSHISFR
ncbi:hypothetical protein FBUS_06105 [Fasciolopsis buskii]|uniref:Uncharacterized protein n=1 Tax=Fasciolopsis buskii TaxID=27845 RepID=A0A8E0RNU7_9TREM|nr:hypothetical protein FBUS_06105 [Fasciolopsis buski]